MSARNPVILFDGADFVTGKTVNLYVYDPLQPNNRGTFKGALTEDPLNAGEYYIDLDESIKGVIEVDGSNISAYEGMIFLSNDAAVFLNKVTLSDQEVADPWNTDDTTHDISGQGFTNPQVIIVQKGEWGVWLKALTATLVTIGVLANGQGECKYDLIITEQP